MASNLRVDTILPSTGTNVAIGTASGSVTFLGDTDITTSGSVSIGGTLTYEDVTNVDSVGVITARSGIRIGATGANQLISGNANAIGFGEADPSPFGGEYRGIDVAYKGSGISGRTGNPTFTMRSNIYYDGSNWKYGEGNTTAGVLSVGGAQLIFESATSGTAGATATITEKLRIDPSGRVSKPFQPFFKAQPSTAQNITSGSGTVVNYQTEIYDTFGIYDASTSTFTAPIGGIYLITWNYFCIPTDKVARANLHKSTNGGGSFAFLHRGDRVGKQGDVYESTSNIAMVDLNANDQLRIQHEEGDLHVNTGYNYFQGYLLG